MQPFSVRCLISNRNSSGMHHKNHKKEGCEDECFSFCHIYKFLSQMPQSFVFHEQSHARHWLEANCIILPCSLVTFLNIWLANALNMTFKKKLRCKRGRGLPDLWWLIWSYPDRKKMEDRIYFNFAEGYGNFSALYFKFSPPPLSPYQPF